MYHGVFIHILDSNNNIYVLNYEELTELEQNFYNTITIEKFSTDRWISWKIRFEVRIIQLGRQIISGQSNPES